MTSPLAHSLGQGVHLEYLLTGLALVVLGIALYAQKTAAGYVPPLLILGGLAAAGVSFVVA